MKVNVISEDTSQDLARSVNQFLEQFEVKHTIIDIKYCLSMRDDGTETHSAMIIYEIKKG